MNNRVSDVYLGKLLADKERRIYVLYGFKGSFEVQAYVYSGERTVAAIKADMADLREGGNWAYAVAMEGRHAWGGYGVSVETGMRVAVDVVDPEPTVRLEDEENACVDAQVT